MNSKLRTIQDRADRAADIAKYALALLLVARAAVFYWFDGQWPTSLRVLACRGRTGRGGAGVRCTTGRADIPANSCPRSRFELRKVVWPTRQEAMRTTWVVIGVVVILSLVLAFFDVVIQPR